MLHDGNTNAQWQSQINTYIGGTGGTVTVYNRVVSLRKSFRFARHEELFIDNPGCVIVRLPNIS